MAASHPFQTDDPRLNPIKDKVLSGERLNEADALALYATGDISTLTGISIPQMYVSRLAGYAHSVARKTLPALTPWRSKRRFKQRRLDTPKQ